MNPWRSTFDSVRLPASLECTGPVARLAASGTGPDHLPCAVRPVQRASIERQDSLPRRHCHQQAVVQFATKLRALLQRRKNRDLFDLNEGLKQLAMDVDKLVACFDHYLALEGRPITRAVAEQRMLEKLRHSLTEDIAPLLPAGVRFDDDDAMLAFKRVWTELIVRIKGDVWKFTDKAIEELRQKNYPELLR